MHLLTCVIRSVKHNAELCIVKNYRQVYHRLRTGSNWLWKCGLLHLALAAIGLILLAVDNRQLLGVNVWVKPLKFALSIAIYSVSWSAVLSYFPNTRLKTRFEKFSVFALSFEMLAIASQAARGVPSHFNNLDTYGIILFSLMGVVITAQTIFALYMGIRWFKECRGRLSQVLFWAIGLGILISGIFALEGGLMGYRMTHSVGSGDLRIAHFSGLHALQLLPLCCVLFRVRKTVIVKVIAAGYFILVSSVFYWTLLGRAML